MGGGIIIIGDEKVIGQEYTADVSDGDVLDNTTDNVARVTVRANGEIVEKFDMDPHSQYTFGATLSITYKLLP